MTDTGQDVAAVATMASTATVANGGIVATTATETGLASVATGRGHAAAGAAPVATVATTAIGGHQVAGELLATLNAEHPGLTRWPVREQVMAATWLAGYRSARTRRAYAADLTAWLDWLTTRQVDVLAARRIHVDLWTRDLLDAGAAHSSVARRLSALTSCYRHLGEHDLIATNPAATVRRPKVDPDHTTTVGLDRDQARALLTAADHDTGPARLRTAAAVRLLLHQGLRVDELARANVTDLGHDRGHRTLTVTRKGGRRIALVLPPATTAALDTYLTSRVATGADRVAGWSPVTSANTASTTVTGHHCWPPAPAGGSIRRRSGTWSAGWPGPPGSSTGPRSRPTRCATPRSPWRWTPARRCGTCRISPGTATPAPRGATTGPGTAWTATPPTPSPPTSPDLARSHGEHPWPRRGGAEGHADG